MDRYKRYKIQKVEMTRDRFKDGDQACQGDFRKPQRVGKDSPGPGVYNTINTYGKLSSVVSGKRLPSYTISKVERLPTLKKEISHPELSCLPSS